MRTIRVFPYDPAWPAMFNQVAKPLKEHLEGMVVAVHHVGSMAVAGLGAKPIIDIDIEMPDEGDFPAIVKALASLGYRHVGDQGVPGREAFKRDTPSPIPHHLYVCRSSSSELRRHLAFRDHLRAHPEARDAYASIKREAARRFPHDIDGYLEHKGRFIRAIYMKCGVAVE